MGRRAMVAQLGLEDPFPPTTSALNFPNGLLAESDGFTPDMLLRAYRQGIFPWNSQAPVRWWTPEPRAIVVPDEMHLSRSLRKELRRDRYRLSVDHCFSDIMTLCGLTRIPGSGLESMDANSEGTWLGPEMIGAYSALQERGYAHSIEVWNADNRLAGGLYGVCIGGAFFGESMFSLVSNASKIALAALLCLMRREGFTLLDCQMETPILNAFGARNVSRLDFEQRLAQTIDSVIDPAAWRLPATCGELL